MTLFLLTLIWFLEERVVICERVRAEFSDACFRLNSRLSSGGTAPRLALPFPAVSQRPSQAGALSAGAHVFCPGQKHQNSISVFSALIRENHSFSKNKHLYSLS